jgi:hypothetical protein
MDRLDGVTFDAIHQKIVNCSIDTEFCGSLHNHLRSEWHSSHATVGPFSRNTPPTKHLIITQSHLIRDFAHFAQSPASEFMSLPHCCDVLDTFDS